MPGHSKAALKRLVDQGGVRVNNAKVDSSTGPFTVREGDILKVGKTRWFKLSLR